MESWIIILTIGVLLNIILTILFKVKKGSNTDELLRKLELLQINLSRIESSLRDDFRTNREELSNISKENRTELNSNLFQFKAELSETLKNINDQARADSQLMRNNLITSLKDFQQSFDANVKSFNDLQREKFGQLESRQNELIKTTESKLEKMRETVEEKLQNTLNERLGQSFELVSKQLENVQKGLGEMQVLAQDVGGLKKVLSNVKMRGGIGEVQLEMLLEQILAPEQYESNVKTKKGSSETVEFAIKLPGKDDINPVVYLPVDAKFPKDAYEQVVDAYETSDLALIETATRNMENVIKKMAKDIHDKYIDPPNTTDFGIMFLPFEGIYAEVVRKASLLELLQRDYKIVVTGPTTFAAILNSLQMGFRTMAIQKRSGEVWNVLGAVKKEFENFGGLLDKAQNNIQTGLNQLDDVMGKRTRAIQRRLKNVEALGEAESQILLTDTDNKENMDETDE
ncbi:MAG: DNA recombination protein RmuC [Bacteroidales bacterium]|jgi:DNA recombination protein RmuC|nr:DNA recombination protein RmuC [Bacteroidales bacterium]